MYVIYFVNEPNEVPRTRGVQVSLFEFRNSQA